MNFWLLKSEPDEFSIDDLRRSSPEPWTGVRNYLARNYLRAMKVGDQAFFYHSSCAEPGIVGIVSIQQEATADLSAYDPQSPYFDANSTREKPRWFAPQVAFSSKCRSILSLRELKSHSELARFTLLQKGNRLSVMPVSTEHWQFIFNLL